MEFGLIAYKNERPNISVKQLKEAAAWFVARLDPDKADRDYDEAFQERGAQISRTDQTFLLRMWGPVADLEKINAACEAHTQPYGPDNAAVPKHQRVYDALIGVCETGLTHRACSSKSRQPLATINITIPWNRYLGDPQAEPAVTEDGTVIPDQMVSRLTPKSWLRRFITSPTGDTLLDVGRKERCAPDPIRQAAGYKQTHCAWHEGCDIPLSWSQSDHIVPFSQGGATSADNMQPLCSTHNRLKHRLQVKMNRQIWEHHHAQNQQDTAKEGGGEGGEGDPAPAIAI